MNGHQIEIIPSWLKPGVYARTNYPDSPDMHDWRVLVHEISLPLGITCRVPASGKTPGYCMVVPISRLVPDRDPLTPSSPVATEQNFQLTDCGPDRHAPHSPAFEQALATIAEGTGIDAAKLVDYWRACASKPTLLHSQILAITAKHLGLQVDALQIEILLTAERWCASVRPVQKNAYEHAFGDSPERALENLIENLQKKDQ